MDLKLDAAIRKLIERHGYVQSNWTEFMPLLHAAATLGAEHEREECAHERDRYKALLGEAFDVLGWCHDVNCQDPICNERGPLLDLIKTTVARGNSKP